MSIFDKESMNAEYKKTINPEHKKNNEFYTNCTKYFEFLRRKGTMDYDFEDEYYFTMPAISNH